MLLYYNGGHNSTVLKGLQIWDLKFKNMDALSLSVFIYL